MWVINESFFFYQSYNLGRAGKRPSHVNINSAQECCIIWGENEDQTWSYRCNHKETDLATQTLLAATVVVNYANPTLAESDLREIVQQYDSWQKPTTAGPACLKIIPLEKKFPIWCARYPFLQLGWLSPATDHKTTNFQIIRKATEANSNPWKYCSKWVERWKRGRGML